MTHHDRESPVVPTAEEYRRPKAMDDAPAAHYTRELPDDVIEDLKKVTPPEFTKAFNHEVDE